MRKWKRSLWISVTTWLHSHQYDTMEHVTAALTHSDNQINILHSPIFKKLGCCPQRKQQDDLYSVKNPISCKTAARKSKLFKLIGLMGFSLFWFRLRFRLKWRNNVKHTVSYNYRWTWPCEKETIGFITHISNMNLSKPGRARESILHVIWGLRASEPHLMMTMMLSKPLYGFLM